MLRIVIYVLKMTQLSCVQIVMKQLFTKQGCSDIQHHTDDTGRYVAGFQDGVEYLFHSKVGSGLFELFADGALLTRSGDFSSITSFWSTHSNNTTRLYTS